ncbi:MAG: leucyl/phenylalanyl-tRNA--protein transferase [Myxococcota bacterium]
MAVYRLRDDLAFPPPSHAEPSGLLAVGGDLSPERLLRAYALGIFPWYEEPPILWFSPDPRMLIERGRLHVSRRLARTLRQERFTLSLDRDFAAVIRACAGAPRDGAHGTWITPEMIEAYERLHALGFAHSCEAWQDDTLVGGVYGVSLGRAFFAESMFHRVRDASKVALITLVWQLEAWGFTLFDCQLPTAHLRSLGASECPRTNFRRRLARALQKKTRRGSWELDPAVVPRRLEALRAQLTRRA